MITTPWSRLRRWQGWRALSVFTNPRMAILSASRIQKTRRRLSRITKRVCVIWKIISGNTKLPLTLRRASTRLFLYLENHSPSEWFSRYKKAEDFVEIFRKMASPPGLEPGAPCLGVWLTALYVVLNHVI